jgi:catechol 2,3-dioxygenase-like lactoylglutathione lyase family enzyme
MAAKKTAKKTTRRTTTKAKAKTKAKTVKPRAGGSALALSSASPSLTVNDFDKSLAFYRDVLGFKVGETWKDASGKPMGAELKAGGVTFWIGQDDWKKGRDRKKGEGFRMFCMTKSVDKIADAIRSKGGRLDLEPTDQQWGLREIALTDPDGFKITIAANRR